MFLILLFLLGREGRGRWFRVGLFGSCLCLVFVVFLRVGLGWSRGWSKVYVGLI